MESRRNVVLVLGASFKGSGPRLFLQLTHIFYYTILLLAL